MYSKISACLSTQRDNIMKKLKILLLLAIGFTSLQSSAEDNPRGVLFAPNGLDGLTIGIINLTDSACVLDSFDLHHGNLERTASPPVNIPRGKGGTFYLLDTLAGPDITVNYVCGNKKISLNCQQNASYLWAGAVHATVLAADPGIYALAHTERGSQLFIKTGKILWYIENL